MRGLHVLIAEWSPDGHLVRAGVDWQLLGTLGRPVVGVLRAVARGDFELGMRILYAAPPTYWANVAFLADRVLTTDELRRFVAAHVVPMPPGTRSDRAP